MSRIGLRASVLLCALLLCHPGAKAAPEGKPVTVPRAAQFDIPSRITGRTYRIWVATPPKADASAAYPVVYVLDGNEYFTIAAALMTRQAQQGGGAATIVGIGYPVDDDKDETGRLRYYELTPSVSKSLAQLPSPDTKTGGADGFLQSIATEIKPFVESHYKIDRSRQVLYGQSLGGLTALRQLFRAPDAFSAYIISSPSIWWNDRDVLSDEAAFSTRARVGDLHLRILVTSAGDEQPKGDAVAAQTRMVDNASELAERLSKLNPREITVVRTIFPGEVHNSVAAVSLNRGLKFALPRK